MLKHMPKRALETFEKTLLYSKEKVVLTGNRNYIIKRKNYQICIS